MENKFKIGYLPLSKVNWTNDTLEAARAGALAFLQQLPGVEVLGGTKMLTLEDEAVAQLAQFEAEQPDLLITHFLTFALGVVPPLYAQRLKTPVILWSMKNPTPGRAPAEQLFLRRQYDGASYVASPYSLFHVTPNPARRGGGALQRSIRVAQAMKMLGRLRIGLIGGRVPSTPAAARDAAAPQARSEVKHHRA